MSYYYGMRLRGYAPGCQPMDGLVKRIDDKTNVFYDILEYDRELAEDEADLYSFTPLVKEEDEFCREYYLIRDMTLDVVFLSNNKPIELSEHKEDLVSIVMDKGFSDKDFMNECMEILAEKNPEHDYCALTIIVPIRYLK